eukprot:GEZU01014365.1.p1 GENE.GEZU01014365.1~~GEZU01014365.1.p1  ORF type:complete len:160 (-),score=44.74 GEZU01014365.1:879-1358(-)
MAQFDLYEEELQESISRIKTVLSDSNNLSSARSCLEHAKETIRYMELDALETKNKTHTQKITNYKRELENLKRDLQKELFGSAHVPDPQQATKILHSSSDMIHRMNKLLAEMEETGVSTLVNLDAQRRQMEGIRDKLGEVNANVHESKKTVDRMSKRWF